MASNNTAVMGKTKRSTDNLIDDAIARQDNWLSRRRRFTRKFLRSLNETDETGGAETAGPAVVTRENRADDKNKNSVLREYWFPIACAIVVLLVAIWAMFIQTNRRIIVLGMPEKPVEIQTTVKTNKNIAPETTDIPTFDIVRIKQDGKIVVAGRWQPNKNVSIVLNGKIVATEMTNADGEFAYAPARGLKPGNYTLTLIGANPKKKSADSVFLYVSDVDYRNSVSLLLTRDGSRVLQSPAILKDGDLIVSKIDYLDTGRLVVSGDALPRLRVSLSLDDKYLGFARVSDYRHFGLGANVGRLVPGREYTLGVRLHDADGQTIATVNHVFVMPEMTGDNDTFYTVRRGDCLWVIARNFLRRGILFSIIAERNNIENPNLIFPQQLLQIPMK